MLINVKNYSEEELERFSSKLLSVIFQLEKSKSDIEFSENVRRSLDYIRDFNEEERRVLNLCIKIFANAYKYGECDKIIKLLDENKLKEVDKMLCDVIENAQFERQEIFTRGKVEGKAEGMIEVAQIMLKDNMSIEMIVKYTNLPDSTIKRIQEGLGN